jgi:hypothetical protein
MTVSELSDDQALVHVAPELFLARVGLPFPMSKILPTDPGPPQRLHTNAVMRK